MLFRKRRPANKTDHKNVYINSSWGKSLQSELNRQYRIMSNRSNFNAMPKPNTNMQKPNLLSRTSRTSSSDPVAITYMPRRPPRRPPQMRKPQPSGTTLNLKKGIERVKGIQPINRNRNKRNQYYNDLFFPGLRMSTR